MNSSFEQMLPAIVVYGAALVVLAWQAMGNRAFSVGLTLTYGACLLLYHAGFIIHCFPWYENPQSFKTILGFQLTALGIVGFTIGTILASAIWARLRTVRGPLSYPTLWQPLLNNYYVVLGILFFFVITPIMSRIPGFAALTSMGIYLIVVGLCVQCWRACEMRNPLQLFWWLALSTIVPIVTMLFLGFIGYGIMVFLMVFIFCMANWRPRWVMLASMVALLYAGSSVYVAYTTFRGVLRDMVWGGRGWGDRTAAIGLMISELRPFDITDPRHLQLVDMRLNQNDIVGASINFMDSGAREYAKGSTIAFAFIALVPRLVWPGKPDVAGSGDIVSKYTGIYFTEGTSVGIGHILEFFINFGRPGVFVGMLLLGVAVRYFDMRAASAKAAGDRTRFAFWFLPGIPLLGSQGALSELTTSMVAGFLVAHGSNHFFSFWANTVQPFWKAMEEERAMQRAAKRAHLARLAMMRAGHMPPMMPHGAPPGAHAPHPSLPHPHTHPAPRPAPPMHSQPPARPVFQPIPQRPSPAPILYPPPGPAQPSSSRPRPPV